MKKFAIITLLLAFMVNTYTVSAWAKACPQDQMAIQATQQSQTMAEMPCHDQKQNSEKTTLQHCDGLCLCIHASIHQVPILDTTLALKAPDLSSETISMGEPAIHSMTHAPPRKPPKSIS